MRDPRKEYPDDTPVAIPARFRRIDSQAARIQLEIQRAVSRIAADQGFETFEEANDFDVGDGDEEAYASPHEMTLDQELELAEYVQRVTEAQRGEVPKEKKTRKKKPADGALSEEQPGLPEEDPAED